ncbi:hypothetical protein [Arcticibacter sp.]|jgi:hypothetical protein|uniref:hypothetical protein n=1 Tax=Arcticibacter sp. TaxID=1872630 RepID=UPI00389025EC
MIPQKNNDETSKELLPIEKLLSYSLEEVSIFDELAEDKTSGKFRSTFAKYSFLREQHAMSIKFYLRSKGLRLTRMSDGGTKKSGQSWKELKAALERSDYEAIARITGKAASTTVTLYEDALKNASATDASMHKMLTEHLTQIRKINTYPS